MENKIQVKDHSVSGDNFILTYDDKYHMYHTSPKPTQEKLPLYYESKNYISHTDSKRSIFEIAYQIVKKITLSQKERLLARYHPKRGGVLDIGAGTGDFALFLKKKKWDVSGIEPNDSAIQLAKNKGLRLSSTINDVQDQTYDVITMWHVLEHVYDLNHQISWIKKHLNKNGTLFIAVPNFESFDAAHYKNHWAAYDVPRHLYHFSKKAIQSLFLENQLELIEVLPMRFDAYYVSLLSEQYKNGSKNYISALRVARQSNRLAKRNNGYSSQIYVLKHRS